MLLDTQDPAGLEGLEKGGEGIPGDAGSHPIMNVSEGQYEICAPCWCNRMPVAGKFSDRDLAVIGKIGSELGSQASVVPPHFD